MKRIWHPYTLWEEVPAGLWTRKSDDDAAVERAVVFMRDTSQWERAMFDVIERWPYSCEHNLSDSGLNRIAWLGQAAVCYARGFPEHVTRKAWWTLTEQERTEADKSAQRAIMKWEQRNA
jgi:hypothetical protein